MVTRFERRDVDSSASWRPYATPPPGAALRRSGARSEAARVTAGGGNLLVDRGRGGKPRVDRFIHGRAEGPIRLDVRAA